MRRNISPGVACRVSKEFLFRTFRHSGARYFEVSEGLLCRSVEKTFFLCWFSGFFFQNFSSVPECRWKLIGVMFHGKRRKAGASRRKISFGRCDGTRRQLSSRVSFEYRKDGCELPESTLTNG